MRSSSPKHSLQPTDYNWFVPIIVALIFLSVGYLLGLVTENNLTPWYDGLAKSRLTPPGWLFSIMWSVLYIMLAFVGYSLWLHRNKQYHRSMWYLFVVQMVLNWLWTPVFFGLHWTGPGFVILLCLVMLNLILTFRCWLINKKLGLLLTPYVLWLFFALYLNFMIWYLNQFL